MINITKEQKQAIETIDGVVCLTAGAGSGKTFVLVNRYFFILDKLLRDGLNVEDALSSILAVTFTNKAANEMKERIAKKFKDEYENIEVEKLMQHVQVCTIDSWAVNFLRDNALSLGLDPSFKVIDPIFARVKFISLAKKFMEDYEYEHLGLKGGLNEFLHSIYQFISTLKGNLIDIEAFKSTIKNSINKNINDIKNIIIELYEKYESWLTSNNYLDFGNLLLKSYQTFVETPGRASLRQHATNSIKFLLVDEYQDITNAQDKLLKKIINLDENPNANYFLVGDIAQSIYGFRGANYKTMQSYIINDSASMTSLALTKNFRSSKQIIDFINKLFVEDENYFQELSCADVQGELPELLITDNPEQEADQIAMKIKEFINQGYNYKDMKILFRKMTNASHYFANVFNNHNIPFKVIGSSEFGTRQEVKDFIAFFKLAEDTQDEKAMLRIQKSGVFNFYDNELVHLKNHKTSQTDIENETEKKLIKFQAFLNNLQQQKSKKTIKELFTYILNETGYNYYIRSLEEVDYLRSLNSIATFKEIITNYLKDTIEPTINGFLDYINEIIVYGALSKEDDINSKDEVVLMSIHQSKGLEFPITFVASVTKGSFPGPNKPPLIHLKDTLILKDSGKDSDYAKYLKEDLDNEYRKEEERVFYVALTRAKEHLIISGYKNKKGAISPFLESIIITNENETTVNENFKNYIQLYHNTNESSSNVRRDGSMARLKNVTDECIRSTIVKSKKTINFYDPFNLTQEINQKNFFSVTSLQSFEKCPRYYYMKYELNIPESENLESEIDHIKYGNLIHKFYEEYYKNFETNKTKSETYWQARVKKLSQDLDIQYKMYNKKEEQIVQMLKNLSSTPIHKQPYMLEQNFTLKLDNIFIRGTIDRIDKLSETTYSITDYKTSTKINPQDYELSMNIYKEAAEQVLGLKIEKLCLYYPFVKKGELKEIQSSKNIKQELQTILQKITSNKTMGRKKSSCAICNYNSVC